MGEVKVCFQVFEVEHWPSFWRGWVSQGLQRGSGSDTLRLPSGTTKTSLHALQPPSGFLWQPNSTWQESEWFFSKTQTFSAVFDTGSGCYWRRKRYSRHATSVAQSRLPFDANEEPYLREALILTQATYVSSPEEYLRSVCKRASFDEVLVSNLDDQDGHFIMGTIQSLKLVFLAVRGSCNSSDWRSNFSAWPCFSSKGTVHSGWFSRTAKAPIPCLVAKALQGYTIVTTGHSLGGAVAQLVAWDLLQEAGLRQCPHLKETRCITFGAPSVMSGEAARLVNNLFDNQFVNFSHPDDVVPKAMSWIAEAIKECSMMTATRPWQSHIDTAAQALQQLSCAGGTSLVDVLKLGDIPGRSILRAAACNAFEFSSSVAQWQSLGRLVVCEAKGMQCISSPIDRQHFYSYANFTLSPDVVFVHKLTTYSTIINSGLATIDSAPYRPLNTPKPQPDIRHVEVYGVKHSSRLLVLNGEKLSFIDQVEIDTAQFNFVADGTLRNLTRHSDSRVEFQLTTKACSSLECPKRATLRVRSFFSSEIQTTPEIQVSYIEGDVHKVHSIRELMSTALLLCTYAPQDTGLDCIAHLERGLGTMFEAVPAEWVLAADTGTYLQLVLKLSMETLKKLYSTRQGWMMLRSLSKKVAVRNFEGGNEFATKMNSIKAASSSDEEEEQSFSPWSGVTFAMMITESCETTNAAKGVIKQLRNAYDEAKKFHMQYIVQLQTACDLDSELAKTYTTLLESLPGISENMASTIQTYYTRKRPTQSDLGNVLDDIRQKWWVRVTCAISGSSLGVAGLAFLGFGLVSAFVVEVGAVTALVMGLVRGAGCMLASTVLFAVLETGWPSRALESCEGLAAALLGSEYVRGAFLGENESRVACRLQFYGVTARSSVDDVRTVLERVYSAYGPSDDMIVHRTKLMLACVEMRAVFVQFPIVLLSGVSEGGKTALRELLMSDMLSGASGGGGAQRTAAPEIFVVNREGCRPYLLLDTVGCDDDNVSKELRKTQYEMLACMVSLEIVIISQEQRPTNETSPVLQLIQKTRSDGPNRSAPLIPTLTCFTKPDHCFLPTARFPEEGGAVQLQLKENMRKTQVYKLEIRREDRCPRRWAVFNPEVHIPEDLRDVIITHEYVQEWIQKFLADDNSGGVVPGANRGLEAAFGQSHVTMQ